MERRYKAVTMINAISCQAAKEDKYAIDDDKREQRTMKSNQTSNSSPDSPPPRMSGNTENDCRTSQSTKADPQPRRITCSGPESAESSVLIFTAIADAARKWAAFEICICKTILSVGGRDPKNGALATFGEAVSDRSFIA
jgi:hypothetical protein